MQRIGSFLGAMLYGAAWVVLLLSAYAAALALQTGTSPLNYAAMILLSAGVITYAHRKIGIFPFRGR